MKTLKQNLQWALQKDNGYDVDPDSPIQDQLAGAPYNKSDGGPKVDTEELLGHAHKTGEYKFESTEEPIEEISDELLYRAQSKAQHLRDKATTSAKKAFTKHIKKGNFTQTSKEFKSYDKHSNEAAKRHSQALKFWRARGRQGSFKPLKELE